MKQKAAYRTDCMQLLHGYAEYVKEAVASGVRESLASEAVARMFHA
ncbi:hypothetical protein [Cohnella sp. WQ 127256]|nr:hypothetical protein [Cohnella sp. WQ 127256]